MSRKGEVIFMSGIIMNRLNLDAVGALSKWDTKSVEINNSVKHEKIKFSKNPFPSIVARPDGKIKTEDLMPIIEDPEQSKAFLWDLITEAVHARKESKQVKADELINLSFDFVSLSSFFNKIKKLSNINIIEEQKDWNRYIKVDHKKIREAMDSLLRDEAVLEE
jgi:hypothetical protein